MTPAPRHRPRVVGRRLRRRRRQPAVGGGAGRRRRRRLSPASSSGRSASCRTDPLRLRERARGARAGRGRPASSSSRCTIAARTARDRRARARASRAWSPPSGGRYLVAIDLVSPERAATAGRPALAPRLERRRQAGAARARCGGSPASPAMPAWSLAVHPHAGSYVEFADEIAAVAEVAPLCLDTGHLAYAGMDAGAVIGEYADRTVLLHLKDVDRARARRVARRRPRLLARGRRGRLLPARLRHGRPRAPGAGRRRAAARRVGDGRAGPRARRRSRRRPARLAPRARAGRPRARRRRAVPDTRAADRRAGARAPPRRSSSASATASAAASIPAMLGIPGHGNVCGIGQAVSELGERRFRSSRPSTSRRWCTPRSATPRRRGGWRRSPAPPRSARARRTS